MEADKLVQQLAAGFEALQEEYRKLHGQHQNLERKLATAREQYNELAKLCDSGAVPTPPLSLTSSPKAHQAELADASSIADVIARKTDSNHNEDAVRRIREAVTAAQTYRQQGLPRQSPSPAGVKIWAGPSADRPQVAVSSTMPSISESPLEQDFTIEGKPSQLGCPFASMANKRLSSHAASVLSRYNTKDSVTGGGGAPSTPLSSVSRVNGKDSLSRRGSRRASFVDPIKAEICGLSDHNTPPSDGGAAGRESSHAPERADSHKPDHPAEPQAPPVENAEVGVCPIRFLDQHSPEEVATYFQKHKHELPRSHEVCVRRYQSNEEQIRELDAKYGNLVSMIQGLGTKHKEYLPDEPADADDDDAEGKVQDAKSAEKVRKWASSVSAQAPDGGDAEDDDAAEDAEGEEERQPHFDRPLREIRVGESPSRPWGLTVPAKYLEETRSEGSSRPAVISSPGPGEREEQEVKPEAKVKRDVPPAKCPFGFDQQPQTPAHASPRPGAHGMATQQTVMPAVKPSARAQEPLKQQQQPTFISSPPAAAEALKGQPRMVFTGPVFIGYSAEDAARILRESGLGTQQ